VEGGGAAYGQRSAPQKVEEQGDGEQGGEKGRVGQVLSQLAYEIDEAAINVKSCLKVNNGLLYRTVSLKLEEVRIYLS
jgi:hypothetical protein